MCSTGRPASAAAAVSAVTAGLAWLTSMDATELTTAEQADCLRALARAESQALAARSALLATFDAGHGFEHDAARGSRSWLRWQTRVSGGAAGEAVGWMRRLAAHPAVAGALATGDISASWARHVCDWAEKLLANARDRAEQILLAAAASVELTDLAGLAEEMYRSCAPPDGDGDDGGHRDRSVRLFTHFRGSGRLEGDLTPECAVALRAVLDACGAKAGRDDDRSEYQRNHDALEEMCRRLIASGCVPDRAGQPTQIQLHMTLDQLLGLDGSGEAAAEWAGHGVTAGPGSDCDASIVPIVSGHVDPEVLDRLAAGLLRRDVPPDVLATPDAMATPDGMATTAARELLLTRASRLLSGPAGLASYLRRSMLADPAASVSLPLDVGAATETIPPHLRRAVITRDRHCAFPGCDQRPAACQVHHIIPRSEGGPTNLDNCLLLCTFHHLIAVHRWGWQIRLNPDGTTTAASWSRVLHGHSPPIRAA
jgi:hypothetical protein